MKRLLFFLMLISSLFLVQSVSAGICNPTCSITSPTADFEREEGTAWYPAISGTMTHSSNAGCNTGRVISGQFQEVGSGTWNDINGFSGNVTYGLFKRLICLGTTCTLSNYRPTGNVVDDYFNFRLKCVSGGEIKYSSSLGFNLTDWTAPVATLYEPDGIAYSENVTFSGKCVDESSEANSITLWTDAYGTWEKNLSTINYSYVDGDIQYFDLKYVDTSLTDINWSVQCNDTYNNSAFAVNNFSFYVSEDYAGPNVTLQSPANASTDSDGVFTAVCDAQDVNQVVNISLWGDWGTGWHLNQTKTDDWTLDESEYAWVQYGHVWATDASGYYAEQQKFDISSFNPSGVEKAEFCMNGQSIPGGLDTDVRAYRVDDQSWNPLTISTSEYNSQTLTNESNTSFDTTPGTAVWSCFDITDAYLESKYQGDTYLTIRFFDPDTVPGSATSLNYFTNTLWFGSSTIPYTFKYLYGVWDGDPVPYLKISTFDQTHPTASFSVNTGANGTFNWTCSAFDQVPYESFAEYNWSVIVDSGSNSCTCPGVDSNWAVNLADYCWLSTPCNLGTGNITFSGSGNFTIDANLNFSQIQAIPGGSFGYLTMNAEVLQSG